MTSFPRVGSKREIDAGTRLWSLIIPPNNRSSRQSMYCQYFDSKDRKSRSENTFIPLSLHQFPLRKSSDNDFEHDHLSVKTVRQSFQFHCLIREEKTVTRCFS